LGKIIFHKNQDRELENGLELGAINLAFGLIKLNKNYNGKMQMMGFSG